MAHVGSLGDPISPRAPLCKYFVTRSEYFLRVNSSAYEGAKNVYAVAYLLSEQIWRQQHQYTPRQIKASLVPVWVKMQLHAF